MIYVTYNPGRRREWTEHTSFPAKAIQLWRDGVSADTSWKYTRHRSVFYLYEVSDDRTGVRFVPEGEWDSYAV